MLKIGGFLKGYQLRTFNTMCQNKMIPEVCRTILWPKQMESRRGAANSKKSTTVGGGSSATYVEDMYNAWLKNPDCVHPSWNTFFRSGLYEGVPSESYGQSGHVPMSDFCGGGPATQKSIEEHIQVHNVIRSYQTRGFLAAQLDPLGIVRCTPMTTKCGMKLNANENVLMHSKTFFKGDVNLDKKYILPPTTNIGGDENRLSFREIIKRMENIYCTHMGVEYMYIFDYKKREWIRKRIEPPGILETSPEKKKLIMKRLLRATSFENFLAKKWSSEKRFGLEGCEVLIPCLKEIIDVSSARGVETFVIGLAHRGRLNTLANICRKPLEALFAQFKSLKAEDQGSGDVKYHLGTFTQRLNRVSNKNIRIALVANPSHLESVNPVVMGKTKAEQFYRGDSEGKKVLSIIIHGDASFCGQGVVFESLHLSDLPSYTIHGTIHIVINNQVGFTTDPRFHRSSPFCTDVARVVNAPIFHVNADDPEASVHLAKVCAEWRSDWGTDVVLDLVGYRRNGHNEIDEPMFTQPLMYQIIRKHKPCLEQYQAKLVAEKILTAAQVKKEMDHYEQILEKGFADAAKETVIRYKDWIDSPWSGFFEGRDRQKCEPTGIQEKTLMHIATKFSTPPPKESGFIMHKGIERILNGRKEMVEQKVADWALGEALAIGSLLKEGIHVRLSGEDVERGTFSHRHHILHHQTVDKGIYNMLAHLYPDQAYYKVCNSSLSEFAVLGFEHGYSMTNPNALVIWEAQFGDFCNTGQCIFDQFISSGEMKWVRQSGLVLLLPHGMEGMGPEHSSCRPERFLQMCHDDPDTFPEACGGNMAIKQLNDTNWIVLNCTTPANLFHALRRQIALPFRKPLIICTPKFGLRYPLARSPFSDFLTGTEFKRIIQDEGTACNPDAVKKLIFCSGKVYFDLHKARAEKKAEKEIAIVRVEQLCPFPFDLLYEEIYKFPNAELIWAQEEHKNMGYWDYVRPRFKTAMRDCDNCCSIEYRGRPTAAAPSTGNKKQHEQELRTFIVSIFGELTEAEKAEIKKQQEATASATKAAASPTKPAAVKPNDASNPADKKK